jgi:hypothetical protein
VGSTEWVEQNIDLLGLNAVAYLNLDTGVGGSGFSAGASPQLDDLLQEVTKQVKDPDSVDGTVFEEWVASGKGSTPLINRLGGGDSDFAAFLQHAGVPALDLHFGDGKGQNLLDQELLTISGELSQMAASLLVELNAIVLRSGRHFKMIQFQGRHTSKGQKTFVMLIWS